jgi:hypothetical protein
MLEFFSGDSKKIGVEIFCREKLKIDLELLKSRDNGNGLSPSYKLLSPSNAITDTVLLYVLLIPTYTPGLPNGIFSYPKIPIFS